MKAFSDDIETEFGHDKCTKATIQKRKFKTSNSVVLDVDTVIKEHRGGTHIFSIQALKKKRPGWNVIGEFQ